MTGGATTVDFAAQRRRMVARQLEDRGIRAARVLDAMRTVPREAFVPPELCEHSYADGPLPIAAGQTISQPYVVALMAEAAEAEAADRVLEIGTGSGYAAAVMAAIAAHVFTVERHRDLGDAARARLTGLGIGNVELRVGDGTAGWPEAAPFDAIIVTAGGPAVPEPLKLQLSIGGRLVIPIGAAKGAQRLLRITRTGEGIFATADLGEVRFVPLIGAHGWSG